MPCIDHRHVAVYTTPGKFRKQNHGVGTTTYRNLLTIGAVGLRLQGFCIFQGGPGLGGLLLERP
jgi:hypothetical protein